MSYCLFEHTCIFDAHISCAGRWGMRHCHSRSQVSVQPTNLFSLDLVREQINTHSWICKGLHPIHIMCIDRGPFVCVCSCAVWWLDELMSTVYSNIRSPQGGRGLQHTRTTKNCKYTRNPHQINTSMDIKNDHTEWATRAEPPSSLYSPIISPADDNTNDDRRQRCHI